MFDWFHIYLVHGVANVEVGLLQAAGERIADINEFINNFTWPAQFRGAAPRDPFVKRASSTEPMKCSGSEGLHITEALRAYVVSFIGAEAPASLQNELSSFLQLRAVLDCLQADQRGVTAAPERLHELITGHLTSFLMAYGQSNWTPKFHMSLHLPRFVRKHQFLINCWCHERKHKVIKNFGNRRTDTSKQWERGILEDLLHGQLEALNNPKQRVGLLNAHPATCKHAQEMRRMLALDDTVPILMATKALHGGNFVVARGDVALLRQGTSFAVGEVWQHIQVGQESLTCFSLWEHVANSMYKIQSQPILVDPASIKAALPFSRKGDTAMVLVPSYSMQLQE